MEGHGTQQRKTMAMEGKDLQMQLMLAPHLKSLRQDMSCSFPGSDPEAFLISWLCERNDVEPPKQAALAGNSGGKPEAKAPTFALAPLTELPKLVPSDLEVFSKREPIDVGTQGFASEPKAHLMQDRLNLWVNRRGQAEHVTCNMKDELRRKLLSKVAVFSGMLSQDEQYMLAGQFQQRSFCSRQSIVQQGIVGNELFVLQDGVCDVFCDSAKGPVAVGELQKGGFFGELSLLYERPYAATVNAKTNVTALVLSREDVCMAFGTDYLERMHRAAHVRIFNSIPLLSQLRGDVKLDIARLLRSDTWSAGEVLAKQSSYSSAPRMYILEKGQCQKVYEGFTTWTLEDGRRPRPPEVLHPGQHFEMLSMFFGSPASCTITAQTVANTVSLGLEELMDVCESWGDAEFMALQTSMWCHLLRQIPQFQTLEDELLTALSQHAKETTYKPWDVIFYKGKRHDTVLILQKGRLFELEGEVLIHKAAAAGTEVLSEDAELRRPGRGLEHSQPGRYFGTQCFRDQQATAPTTLVARSDCTMLCIPGSILRGILKRQLPCSRPSFDHCREII